MPVVHHVLPAVVLPALAPPAGRLLSAEWAVFPLDAARSTESLGPLVEACNALGEPGPRFSLAGIAGDLAGRAGRMALGFVAGSAGRTAADGTGGGPESCLGLAVLIEAAGRKGRRFSIATLLVHPAMRRRGIAAALVRHSVAHVRSCGGTEVGVETHSDWPAAAAFWRAFTAERARLVGLSGVKNAWAGRSGA